MTGELRRALRSLARRRTYAAAAVLTLALAFSLPVVVLSTLDRHFWRPPDLVDADRLFTLQLLAADGSFPPLSHPEYVQLRDAGEAAYSVAAFGQLDFTLVAGRASARTTLALVSPNFFTVLGAQPVLGRLPAPPDGGADRAVALVLSHRAWTTHFGRDASVVGRSVRLDGQAFVVMGVARNPLPGPAHDPDFWAPFQALPRLAPDIADALLGPTGRWLTTVGRLHGSTSRDAAAARAATAGGRLPEEVVATRTGDWRFVLRPVHLARLGAGGFDAATGLLGILLAISAFFLLAACCNVALLLLTRGGERSHELAVRRALGASPLDLVRPFAVELLLLAAAGGAVAVLLLRWVGPVVAALPQLAPLGGAEVASPRTVLWTLVVAGSAWAMVCLPVLALLALRRPALPAAPSPTTSRRGGGPRAIVAAQVAVACGLVVAAGLLAHSAWNVASVPRGFAPQDVLIARVHPAGTSAADGQAFYRRLLGLLRSDATVASAALGWHVPLSGAALRVAVQVPGVSLEVAGNVVSPDYFRTLGVAVLEGREFDDSDHADAPPVALVNRTLAERLWPGGSAVGRILGFPRSGGDRTVVGVVDDTRYGSLTERVQPLAYLPLAQRFFPTAFIHAQSVTGTPITLPHLRRLVGGLDPGAPLSDAGLLHERIEAALDRWRAPARLAGLIALATLVLTMCGLYGVVSLAVRQRTRELAVRAALGADAASLRRLVLAHGLRPVAVGALIGLAGSAPLTRLLDSQLYRIAPYDPPAVAAGLVVLLGAGALACHVPARRAARLDPASALRSE
ncbi:MAG: ABC transporter permease [Acidobacteria bacterium]|nr:ABC transporter permease [Acidobacteriota bacterium]